MAVGSNDAKRASIDGVTSLSITASRIKADGIGTCIRLINASAGVRIDGNRFSNGQFGIYVDGSGRFSDHNITFALPRDSRSRRSAVKLSSERSAIRFGRDATSA